MTQDIDKIYLYVKDPYEAKYEYVINKHKKLGLKDYNGPNPASTRCLGDVP